MKNHCSFGCSEMFSKNRTDQRNEKIKTNDIEKTNSVLHIHQIEEEVSEISKHQKQKRNLNKRSNLLEIVVRTFLAC